MIKHLNNMFGIKMSDVQSHVDKKISQAHNLIINKFATVSRLQSLEAQHRALCTKLRKLEEYLGVEYEIIDKTEYAKVKKTKKTKK